MTMKTSNQTNQRFRKTGLIPGFLIAIGFIFSSCDLDVLDPSSVEDVDLDSPEAIGPLLAGVEGDFAVATTASDRPGGTISAGAFLTDELVHSGQYDGMREWNEGVARGSTSESSTRWSQASRARWVAEDAIRRISDVVDDPQSDTNVGQANMWAGFANRVMGDTFCEAVINEGPLEPHTVFFERAEEYFTDAIAIAEQTGETEYALAAYGGRAQTRMMTGDWDGASDDAAMLETDFVFEQRHSSNTARESNGLYRTYNEDAQSTVWGTPFAEWGTQLNEDADHQSEGDPRVPFAVELNEDGEQVVGGDNRRPLYRVHKYEDRDQNVPVVKGTEMRLIEAEAYLVAGNVPEAIDKINEVRDYHGLSSVTATSEEEAWEVLQKERGIELWLEGRRLPDVRRWAENPGTVPFEVVRETSGNGPEDDAIRNVLNVEQMCLPVSSNEITSNPNID